MEKMSDNNRWQSLFYMFVALASGNFSYKIQRTNRNDELEAMVALSNILSEELQETFKHHGFIEPRRTYRYLSKMDFYLNKDFEIINFSTEVPALLEISPENLLKHPLPEFLTANSIQAWEEIKPGLKQENFQRSSLELEFVSGKDLTIKSNCYISSLFSPEEKAVYAVSSFTPKILDESEQRSNKIWMGSDKNAQYSLQAFSHQSDIKKVHQVRDYILQNLSNEIPDMKELAHIFYTNESKLKNDYKAVFGITPFQFMKAERLKLAKELIQNTNLPLKNISHTCGYQNYPHFSYAFKEEFGISPKEFRKTAIE